MMDTVMDALRATVVRRLPNARVSGRSSREGLTNPAAGRCRPQAFALAAALLVFAGGGGGGGGGVAEAQIRSVVGEPPAATATASAATGRLCINIPSPPSGIHSRVRSGLDVKIANGGTATHGRGDCGTDVDLVSTDGAYGSSFIQLGDASLGQNNCFQVEICGAHAVGRTFAVVIDGKVHPKKPENSMRQTGNTTLNSWTNNLRREGYSASFKPAAHCWNTASYYGGASFAAFCRTMVTIVN